MAAAEADFAIAREIGDAFGLDILTVAYPGAEEAAVVALAAAPNVGFVLSVGAARDPGFNDSMPDGSADWWTNTSPPSSRLRNPRAATSARSACPRPASIHGAHKCRVRWRSRRERR